jgi:hypothetical protein
MRGGDDGDQGRGVERWEVRGLRRDGGGARDRGGERRIGLGGQAGKAVGMKIGRVKEKALP